MVTPPAKLLSYIITCLNSASHRLMVGRTGSGLNFLAIKELKLNKNNKQKIIYIPSIQRTANCQALVCAVQEGKAKHTFAKGCFF